MGVGDLRISAEAWQSAQGPGCSTLLEDLRRTGLFMSSEAYGSEIERRSWKQLVQAIPEQEATQLMP